MISTLKEVREALNFAYNDCESVFVQDQKIEPAIAKLDALIAQRESGDDGLAQQYTKLSAHCQMLEDKLATLTNAIGAKQMADFVAKHAAPQPAPSTSEPVVFDAAVVDYIARFGGICKDCADQNGVCPSSGLPCGDRRKGIKFVLDALAYGVNNKYLTPIAAPQSAAEPVVEMHEALCPALTGGRCECVNPAVVDKAWAQFCGGVGRGNDAPYPGMIEAFEAHYSQSFIDKDWRAETGVWAASWAAAKRHAAPQSAPSTIPLTDEQIEAIYEGLKGKGWSKDFARAIEAAHKIGAKP